jgi:parvulin-like peptidyl-prolyl isomerase
MRVSAFAAVCGLLLGVTACRRSPSAAHRAQETPSPAGAASAGDVVLARFDGRVLTLREFDERLASQPPSVRAEFANPEARERLLEEMVRLELLLDEAKRRGFDRTPRVRVRVSELIVEEMMSSLFGSEGAEASKITDEEVQSYYDAHSAEFSTPEERRASDIVFGDRPRAEAVFRQLGSHPGDEAFFRQRARDERGDTKGPGGSGDGAFFSEQSSTGPEAPLREAVFQLHRVGDITKVVESGGRFHVLMLTGVRPALVRKPGDVQTLIRARLSQEKRRKAIAEFTDGLRSRANTRIDGELVRHSSAAPSSSAATGTR